MTAAATARMVSRGLLTGTATAEGWAGRGGAGAAARVTVAGAAAPIRGAAGTAAGAAVADNAGAGAAVEAAAGPPGGRVGNLMVGAAEGFGGKLIRTVSFFGWTFPVSFFGGTAPAGMFGMFSAINQVTVKLKSASQSVKPLFGRRRTAEVVLEC